MASHLLEDVWLLPHIEPRQPEEWDAVCRGGNNGLFLVVLSLAWWICACHGEEQPLDDVLVAVEDMSWVCCTSRPHKALHGVKRSAADTDKISKPLSK